MTTTINITDEFTVREFQPIVQSILGERVNLVRYEIVSSIGEIHGNALAVKVNLGRDWNPDAMDSPLYRNGSYEDNKARIQEMIAQLAEAGIEAWEPSPYTKYQMLIPVNMFYRWEEETQDHTKRMFTMNDREYPRQDDLTLRYRKEGFYTYGLKPRIAY